MDVGLCAPHHKITIHHFLMEDARQGLENLSHSAVTYNDHALSPEALGEV